MYSVRCLQGANMGYLTACRFLISYIDSLRSFVSIYSDGMLSVEINLVLGVFSGTA